MGGRSRGGKGKEEREKKRKKKRHRPRVITGNIESKKSRAGLDLVRLGCEGEEKGREGKEWIRTAHQDVAFGHL